jgi:hypothetical protein
MAPRNKEVRVLNNAATKKLIDSGADAFESICYHVPTKTVMAQEITENISKALFKVGTNKDKLPQTSIVYAINSRVRVNMNIATQVGIFTGAQVRFLLIHY